MIDTPKVIRDNAGTISIGIHNNTAKFEMKENAQKAKQIFDSSGCYNTGNVENKNNQYSFSYVLKRKSLEELIPTHSGEYK